MFRFLEPFWLGLQALWSGLQALWSGLQALSKGNHIVALSLTRVFNELASLLDKDGRETLDPILVGRHGILILIRI